MSGTLVPSSPNWLLKGMQFAGVLDKEGNFRPPPPQQPQPFPPLQAPAQLGSFNPEMMGLGSAGSPGMYGGGMSGDPSALYLQQVLAGMQRRNAAAGSSPLAGGFGGMPNALGQTF